MNYYVFPESEVCMDSINFGVKSAFYQDVASEDPESIQTHILHSTATLNKRDNELMFATHKFPVSEEYESQSHIARFELTQWSKIDAVLELVEHHIERGQSLTRSVILDVNSVEIIQFENEENADQEIHPDITEVTFTLHDSLMNIYVKDDVEIFMPFDERFHYDEPATSLEHLVKFRDAMKEILVEFEPELGTLELVDTELSARCVSKFERGEYVAATSTGLKILEERVKESAGEDLSDLYGRDLMMQAFNPEIGPLAFGENENEEQGVMFLYAGAIQALRNPLHHRTPKADGHRHLDRFDKNDARNILQFVDFLISKIEGQSS